MKKLTFIAVLVMFIGICFTVSVFAEFYVIPVPNKCGPCKGTRSAGGRWCDNGDGTVTDMTRCLVWLKYADWGGETAWEDCTTHIDAHSRVGILASGETISPSGETPVLLNDGSALGDWRLPTKEELESIFYWNVDEVVKPSTPRFFEGVTMGGYWSSTTCSSPSEYHMAHYVYSNGGNAGASIKTVSLYVWPVRSAYCFSPN